MGDTGEVGGHLSKCGGKATDLKEQKKNGEVRYSELGLHFHKAKSSDNIEKHLIKTFLD